MGLGLRNRGLGNFDCAFFKPHTPYPNHSRVPPRARSAGEGSPMGVECPPRLNVNVCYITSPTGRGGFGHSPWVDWANNPALPAQVHR
jgi:hypothetical protein